MIKRIMKRRAEGSTRKDDANLDTVKHRLETFHNTTMPAIQWLGGRLGNIKFSDIDSSEQEQQNFARILSALNIPTQNA
jgi:adenylate kinase family enzyme